MPSFLILGDVCVEFSLNLLSMSLLGCINPPTLRISCYLFVRTFSLLTSVHLVAFVALDVNEREVGSYSWRIKQVIFDSDDAISTLVTRSLFRRLHSGTTAAQVETRLLQKTGGLTLYSHYRQRMNVQPFPSHPHTTFAFPV